MTTTAIVLRAPTKRCPHLHTMTRVESDERDQFIFFLSCSLCTDVYRVIVTRDDVLLDGAFGTKTHWRERLGKIGFPTNQVR